MLWKRKRFVRMIGTVDDEAIRGLRDSLLPRAGIMIKSVFLTSFFSTSGQVLGPWQSPTWTGWLRHGSGQSVFPK